MLACRTILAITLLLGLNFAHAEEPPELSADLRTAAAIAAGVPEDELEDASLASVRALVLNHRGTVDLSGIARLKNLEALELRGNSIADISALSALATLRYLDLTDNRIENLDPLGTLDQLRYLDVSSNLVVSLAPVRGLHSLVALHANNNAIEDLQPLGPLTDLQDLRLAYNRIDNLDPLAPLTGLRRLDLEHNRIHTLGPLAGLTQLARLDITNNRVDVLGPLSSMTRIRILRAKDNPIVDIAPLAKLERLEVLRLATTKFDGNLGPLMGLNRLRVLEIPRSDIEAIDPLLNLMALERIDLANNQIRDAGPLVRVMLTAETVDLRGNPLNVESRVRHLPRMLGKARFDGVVVTNVKALFQQFAQLDRDKSGGLSYPETGGLDPAISLEQFDALDGDQSLYLTRAELYPFARPGANSLDVAWLGRKHIGYADGSKQAPYSNWEDAFAALKPNGTLMLYDDAALEVSKLSKPMRIVRVATDPKSDPGVPNQQQTRQNPQPGADTAPKKPARVVSPQIRSVYPKPEQPESEPVHGSAPAASDAPPAPN